MLTQIKSKIRAVVGDIQKIDKECFTYTNSSIFTIAESNLISIISVVQHFAVLPSGETSYDKTLESGEFSWDSITNELTITADLSNGDLITVTYSYYKYSETELDSYVNAALTWIGLYGDDETVFVESADELVPTPTTRMALLIVMVASIIIKPEYDSYRTANISIYYPRSMDKDEKIQRTIRQFNMGIGVNDLLEFDENDYYFWKL